jgi:transposase
LSDLRKQEIALKLGEGMTIEAIARVTGLSVEVVQKLQQEYQP